MEKIELLAPAGDLERLKIAIMYGADAVFVGGKRFSLRSRASNFTIEDITEGVEFAKEYGAKIHVTVNMLPHDEDFEGLKEYILALDKAGVYAVICASLHIAKKVIEMKTNMEVHLSTQQSSLNTLTTQFYKELGVDRVVLGRELEMSEIKNISKNSNIEIEAFIHGGMCSNYSGRCTLSNFMTFRDANRGGCAQSCRWKYHVLENGQEISDSQVLFSMSSKDLMAAKFIPQLIQANVSSLKIEGRMKSLYYIATVVRGYRHLIDYYYQNTSISENKMQYFIDEITRAENRPVDIGFYKGRPDESGHLYQQRSERVTHDFLGKVLKVKENKVLVEVRNKFQNGDVIEFFGPELKTYKLEFNYAISNKEEEKLEVCNVPMQQVWIETSYDLKENYLIRKG